MKPIVMKFGGTSVADVERINHVADIVVEKAKSHKALVVVVSAMAGDTDRLDRLAREVSGGSPDDEYDVVSSAGEQISAGLLALALRKRGYNSRSWLSWQLPVRTTSSPGRADIIDVGVKALRASIMDGEIAVMAGYQGVCDGRLTTLGRGGSDTSAVAIAAVLQAQCCDIYTDVDGVYTSDPRIVAKARHLERIAHEEMLEMASLGAKILQTRSVGIAMAHKVRLRVLPSFPGGNDNGTIICDEEQIVEKQVVTGVTCSADETKFSLLGVKDTPGIAACLFSCLAEIKVNVDMIVQAASRMDGFQNIVFTVGGADADIAREQLERHSDMFDFDRLEVKRDVAKISVIGIGMRSHAGVACIMFETLADKGVNIEVISTSEIRISVLIDSAYTELAMRALHTAYGLDEQ